jgi:hypothetical protein
VLALRYTISLNRSESQQSTFGRGDGKYAELVDSLSNHYQNDVFSQASTINIQSSGKPLTYTIGSDLLQYSNRQEDVLKDSVLRYRYMTLNPRVNARYAIGKNQGISFNYSANTQQPSITQLQPVQNNNNPLYITLGNPNLRSSFAQNFGLNFDMVKPVFLSLGVNYGNVSNAISTKVVTDSLGRQISQAVNVSGSEYGGVNFNVNHKVMPAGIDLGANGNFSVSRNVSYVGALLSDNDAYNAGGGVSVGKYVANQYSVRVSTNANYSYSVSSVNPGLRTKFWTQNDNFELSYFILPGLELNSNGYYVWHQKTSVFDKDNSVFLWNAFVAKNFLQNRLVVKWRVNDILGQNVGIGRSISGNVTTQTASNMIGRYWMLSVSYRFIRHGKLK